MWVLRVLGGHESKQKERHEVFPFSRTRRWMDIHEALSLHPETPSSMLICPFHWRWHECLAISNRRRDRDPYRSFAQKLYPLSTNENLQNENDSIEKCQVWHFLRYPMPPVCISSEWCKHHRNGIVHSWSWTVRAVRCHWHAKRSTRWSEHRGHVIPPDHTWKIRSFAPDIGRYFSDVPMLSST